MHIDGWTLLLQALNLVVLLALLRWLFYRPLLAVIDARRQALVKAQAQTEALRVQAQASAAELAQQQAEAKAAAELLLQSARNQAAAESEASAYAAKVATEQCLREAQAQIERERVQATQALFTEASALAVELARQLLLHTPSHDAHFVAPLLDKLAETDPDERQHWFAQGAVRTVTVCTAHAAEADERALIEIRLRQTLGEQLDSPLEIHFDTDPALIAGAELRFAHGVLGLSWAAELRAAQTRLQEATAVTP
jgi:F-type H+-transporting ATPase subunit b